MSVSSTEHLDKLAFILYDRPAGRNVIGYAIERIEQLRAENERLIRLKKLLDRNEREFLAAIGLATTTVLGPGHDPSLALSSMRLVLAKFEKLRAEIERLREALQESACACSSIRECASEWAKDGKCPHLIARNALEGKP